MPSSNLPSEPHSHPDIPPFPSPSTFSILPDIYLLIARLNILQNQGQANSQQTQSQTQTQAQSQSHTQSQSQPPASSSTPALSASHIGQGTPSGTLGGAASTPAAASISASTQATTTTRHIQTSGPPIDVKELPAHVYPIKQKLGKARAAVAALPDLDRSVEQQDVEIRQLERQVALLKARLAKLGAIAATSAAPAGPGVPGDTAMQGVDG